MASVNGAHQGWSSGQVESTSQTITVDVMAAKAALLAQEDTNKDGKITVDDTGPKAFLLQSSNDAGTVEVTGTYHLANLLQELALAETAESKSTVIQLKRLSENPVDRIQRRIEEEMWSALFRTMDATNIVKVSKDPKDPADSPCPRIYVPATAPYQYDYYQKMALERPECALEVCLLPKDLNSPGNPWNLNQKNGILAMDMFTGGTGPHPLPYVVPGHRFNEFYGWDSYFCALGLLEIGNIDICVNIVRHYIFQIDHYGSILNANRSYYLGRSHPPFLTDLVLRIYDRLNDTNDAKDFLRRGILTAIKEYQNVWMSSPRYDPTTGLSRYRANQRGIPPEVEPGHFDWFLQPYADRAGMTVEQLSDAYNNGTLDIPELHELDTFLVHDGSIRESGHDNSYRLEDQCADLVTVDLNSLLYKYEMDIAKVFEDKLLGHIEPCDSEIHPEIFQASYWLKKAARRKELVNKYSWDEESGMFHDYNTATKKQTKYKSVTSFWTLWCGLASVDQAETMVKRALPQFENVGGVTSTVEQPFDKSGPARRQRQWDYPFGWAPHQITLWDGLQRYGYEKEAQRLAYRWLYLLTRISADYNGTITEKYDVTRLDLDKPIHAEYGNLGIDFQGVPLQGFGWTNASYSYGLKVLNDRLRGCLRDGFQWYDIENLDV